MIRKSLLERIVGDPRLTPEAVRVILHVALKGEGEHEIDAEELMALLRCKSDKPVRNAVRLAEKHHYLSCRQGGRGHSNRYRYLDPTAEVSSDNPDRSAEVNKRYHAPQAEVNGKYPGPGAEVKEYPDPEAEVNDTSAPGQSYPEYLRPRAELSSPHAREQGEPSSPSSSPPGRAREKSLERLKAWLGPGAAAVDELDRNGQPHRANWADHVWGAYCREEEPASQIARKLSREEMRAVLEQALSAYALKDVPFDPAYFDGFVRNAAIAHSRDKNLDLDEEAKRAIDRDRERAAARINGRHRPPADETPDEKKAREERERLEAFFAEPENEGLRELLERQAEAEAENRRLTGPSRAAFVKQLVARLAKDRMKQAGALI